MIAEARRLLEAIAQAERDGKKALMTRLSRRLKTLVVEMDPSNPEESRGLTDAISWAGRDERTRPERPRARIAFDVHRW